MADNSVATVQKQWAQNIGKRTGQITAYFLTVPWVGLQCVIVVFHDHTYLFFNNKQSHSFDPQVKEVAVALLIVKR